MGDSLLGRVRRGPILLVLATGNLLAVAAAVAAAGPISGTAPSRSTIGRTWPIAEPDALAEIEAKVATLPSDMSKAFGPRDKRSEEHTSELQSLMRISYAVFCVKKKN